MNWFDGAEYCYYQNAMLAQIPDLSTQIFLEGFASQINNGNRNFWLGANDIFTVSLICLGLLYILLIRKQD